MINPAPDDISAFNVGDWQFKPIKGALAISHTYGDSYQNFPNVFQLASWARMNGSSNTVAVFGQAEAAQPINPQNLFGAAWGGNFVAIASVKGGQAQGVEIDAVNFYGPGAVVYGLIVGAFGNPAHASKSDPAQSAISIQIGNDAGIFRDGIVFNDIVHAPVSGSLIKANSGSTAEHAINIAGSYSEAEIITPSFLVDATPVNLNSRVAIVGSESGNPTISAAGCGDAPAADANLVIASLGDGGISFQTESRYGPTQFEISDTPDAVNHLIATGGVKGSGSVVLTAHGEDSDIDILLVPKGTGTVRTALHGSIEDRLSALEAQIAALTAKIS
jgi:hypothetical protein